MVQFSHEYVEEFLRQMYAGEIATENLPESLYHGIADYLKSGLYEGFGVGEKGIAEFVNTPDFALLEELRENIYMFSAAKTYQEVREISSLLTDGDRVRTRDEFNKIGRETFDKWNTDWARSEYTTAVGQASMALKWNDIDKNKDILPILVFSTNGSGCEECAPYNNFAAPVDDPIWDWLYPLLHFNCMCIVLQQEEGYPVTEGEDYDRIAAMKDNVPDVFQMNSGRDKVIFSDDHPYFDVAKKDVNFAKDNFGLPIPPVGSELPRNTKKDQVARSKNIIEEGLGLIPKKVIVADDLSLETYTAMNEQLSTLFHEYKVSEVYNPKATPTVKFKSTSKYLGYISSSNEGTYLEEINFGSKTSNARIDDKAILRARSRVDADKVHLSTLTHEFAHLITIDRQQVRYATDERLKDFMPQLREIKARYLREIKELHAKSSRIAKLSEMYLGDYASTNINEFMAEAFTEYKLCSDPSKYAVEVGKLIDKTFKK